MKRISDGFYQLIAVLGLLFSSHNGLTQSVSEIITDYNGFWRSEHVGINSVKPLNSHNLLAFTFNGTRFSTGVNDTVISNRGLPFIPGDFKALPVASITTNIISNTKVALGAMYDGTLNGPSIISPSASLSQYLTDGVRGLNIGTGIANLPSGRLEFSVSNLQPSAIGDGIPDVLITQIADPSGTTDTYQFVNDNGDIVGNTVSISFSAIPAVGDWTADFYEASIIPMILNLGFTNTDRPIRLWAADISAFGVTVANYSSISKLRINLAGNSDVAFIAYNHATVSVLPVRFLSFTANGIGKDVQLSWTTAAEQAASHFDVEGSTDGRSFSYLGKVVANNGSLTHYSFLHRQNTFMVYYRLKQVDNNGSFSYSPVIRISKNQTAPGIQVYPNPAKSLLTIAHKTGKEGTLHIYNSAGVDMLEKKIQQGTLTTDINVADFPSGIYQVIYSYADVKETRVFVKD